MNTVSKRIEPWPIGIACFFAVLIASLATWAVVAQRNREEAWPAASLPADGRGRVRLYRPSEAALDRELPLAVGADGVQSIDAGSLKPGLWKVRVHWGPEDAGYYAEGSVVVPTTVAAVPTR
ncbi:MAG: hypothetical protein EBU81_02315 [Proteobacteria bacterium]|nr:hypothetical protein [Pseudomonadota bacterium]